jgi:fido (protein-threonine AMPylation protein)
LPSTGSERRPYLDPRSGVFRNRLGLTDRAALAIAEKQFASIRVNQLGRRRLPGQYALHPFREGNGRTQRAFLGQLARDAGYRLRWEHVDRDANIDAARAAADGDLAPMRALLEPVVERVRQRR